MDELFMEYIRFVGKTRHSEKLQGGKFLDFLFAKNSFYSLIITRAYPRTSYQVGNLKSANGKE
jgi:hypothetical protein